MEREPSLPSAPSNAISNLLRGIASRFVDAGKTHGQWRQGYARVVGEPTDRCALPPGYEGRSGVDWSVRQADPIDGPVIVMAGPSGPPGRCGQDVFETITLEVWNLLSEPITRKPCCEITATREWLAAVYARLADTPYVRDVQRRDRKGALWQLRELTIDPFTASAKAIELFLADWGLPVELRSDEAAAGSKTAQPARRRRPMTKNTTRRRKQIASLRTIRTAFR